MQSLVELSERINGLPRQIQTRDPKLAAAMKARLERFGVEVVVRESLPMLDDAAESMDEFKGLGVKKEPSLIESPGMTLDRMIGFADAAEMFYKARPWQHLIERHQPGHPSSVDDTEASNAQRARTRAHAV